jgi:hypothetical protein
MTGQADPLGIGTNPDLRHRHAEDFAAAPGVDGVDDRASKHRDIANDGHCGILECLAAPAIPSICIRVHVIVSVEAFASVGSPDELGMQKLPEPIRVPGSQSIRARRRSQQNSPRNVHASGSHALSAADSTPATDE